MRAFASAITPWILLAALTAACGSETGTDGSNANGGVFGSVSGSAGVSGAAGAGKGGTAGAAGGSSGSGSSGVAGTSSSGGAGGGIAGSASGSSGASATSGAGGGAGAAGGAGGAPQGGAAGAAGLAGASGSTSGTAGGGASGAGGAAGGAGAAGTGGGGDELCAERMGGALVEAEVLGETLRFWTTNDAFIQELEDSIGAIPERIPLLELADGRDCDSQWTFHFDPATPRFVDDWIDICDVELSRIEGDKTFYLANGDFCPRFMHVESVSVR
jgi:hypothetical protein